jgi:hypothetical protein
MSADRISTLEKDLQGSRRGLPPTNRKNLNQVKDVMRLKAERGVASCGGGL